MADDRAARLPRSVRFDGKLRTAQVIRLDGKLLALDPDVTADDARQIVAQINSGEAVATIQKVVD